MTLLLLRVSLTRKRQTKFGSLQNDTVVYFQPGSWCDTLSLFSYHVYVPQITSNNTWLWLGILNNDWFEPCNWDKAIVPDTTSLVVIPGNTPYQPLIANDTGYCKTIEIYVDSLAHTFIDHSSGGHLIKIP